MSQIAPHSGPATTRPQGAPLYQQVKALLIARLADGTWRAGQPLPSEFSLADELGVSQGTVRKALDEMTAENLVVRRQGRGTFAAEPDDAHILFNFFKVTPDEGARLFPESQVLDIARKRPDDATRKALGLKGTSRVIDVTRIRLIGGAPVVHEHLCVGAAQFAGLEAITPLPNNLYQLFATR